MFSESIKFQYRACGRDFTRMRKQTFSSTVLFMLNLLTKSLSIEINHFLNFICQTMKDKALPCFSKSAFTQCRKKIKPEVFQYLSTSLVKEFYTDNEESVKLWQGLRILAVDGSRLTLPDTKELEKIYGRTKNQNGDGLIQARISVLYDVLNRFALEGSLSTLPTGETVLAFQHLEHAGRGDLIIYDRGYPSFELIYEHSQRQVDFLIRVKKDFSHVVHQFYQSGLSSDMVKMYPGKNTTVDKPYTKESFEEVRLVRVVLPTGEVEILITSLVDREKYPDSIFKDLYFLRWGIETFYDELKNKVKTEHFSGYSLHCILQDFYAALLVSNVQSLIVGEINEELALKPSGRKYRYKVNTSLSYGFLKDRIITLFFSDKDMGTLTAELKELFRNNLIPIRPNRQFERNVDKYRKRTKPKLLKNRKDAI